MNANKHISIRAFSRKIGIPYETVRYWVKVGKVKMTPCTVMKIPLDEVAKFLQEK